MAILRHQRERTPISTAVVAYKALRSNQRVPYLSLIIDQENNTKCQQRSKYGE